MSVLEQVAHMYNKTKNIIPSLFFLSYFLLNAQNDKIYPENQSQKRLGEILHNKGFCLNKPISDPNVEKNITFLRATLCLVSVPQSYQISFILIIDKKC